MADNRQLVCICSMLEQQIQLTQSVVKGAPLAISDLTSSSCPLRAASNKRFPKSTSDI